MAKPDGEKEKETAAGKDAGKGPGVVARFCAGLALVALLCAEGVGEADDEVRGSVVAHGIDEVCCCKTTVERFDGVHASS